MTPTFVYGIRCSRCLLSMFDTQPRALYTALGEHVCDESQLRYVRAMRSAPAHLPSTFFGKPLDDNTEGK